MHPVFTSLSIPCPIQHTGGGPKALTADDPRTRKQRSPKFTGVSTRKRAWDLAGKHEILHSCCEDASGCPCTFVTACMHHNRYKTRLKSQVTGIKVSYSTCTSAAVATHDPQNFSMTCDVDSGQIYQQQVKGGITPLSHAEPCIPMDIGLSSLSPVPCLVMKHTMSLWFGQNLPEIISWGLWSLMSQNYHSGTWMGDRFPPSAVPIMKRTAAA